MSPMEYNNGISKGVNLVNSRVDHLTNSWNVDCARYCNSRWTLITGGSNMEICLSNPYKNAEFKCAKKCLLFDVCQSTYYISVYYLEANSRGTMDKLSHLVPELVLSVPSECPENASDEMERQCMSSYK